MLGTSNQKVPEMPIPPFFLFPASIQCCPPGILGIWFVLLDPDEARSVGSMAAMVRDVWYGMAAW